jgi:hypothetical protein
MRPRDAVRYGKTCDRCGRAITTAPGERALCARHERDEIASRVEGRR